MTTTGYLRQDDSSHWYAVPKDKIDAFDKAIDKIYSEKEESERWYDAIDQFELYFGEYRTGGGYQEFEIIIK